MCFKEKMKIMRFLTVPSERKEGMVWHTLADPDLLAKDKRACYRRKAPPNTLDVSFLTIQCQCLRIRDVNP